MTGGGSFTFTGAAGNTLATGWVFTGVAIGWEGEGNNAMACVTTYNEASSGLFEEC